MMTKISILLLVLSACLNGCIDRQYDNPVDPILHDRVVITGIGVIAEDDEFSEGLRLDIEVHMYETGSDAFLACTERGLTEVDSSSIFYTVNAGFVKSRPPYSELTMQDFPDKSVYVQVFETDVSRSCPNHAKGVDDVIGTSPPFTIASLEQPLVLSFDNVFKLRLASIPH